MVQYRYVTVLYRYGGDLLHAFNVSLGSSRVQTAARNNGDTGTTNDFQNNLTCQDTSASKQC